MMQTPPSSPSPRESASVLRQDTAASLLRDGANTNIPCPVADEIFEQLYGRLWLQATIIRRHKSAEELLKILKLDYDATLEFYKQRRESTNRETINFEDDEELQDLLHRERNVEMRILQLQGELLSLEEQERAEMERWLGQYSISQLVHQGRVTGYTAQQDTIKLRMSLLDDNTDLLTTCKELLADMSEIQVAVPEPEHEEDISQQFEQDEEVE